MQHLQNSVLTLGQDVAICFVHTLDCFHGGGQYIGYCSQPLKQDTFPLPWWFIDQGLLWPAREGSASNKLYIPASLCLRLWRNRSITRVGYVLVCVRMRLCLSICLFLIKITREAITKTLWSNKQKEGCGLKGYQRGHVLSWTAGLRLRGQFT